MELEREISNSTSLACPPGSGVRTPALAPRKGVWETTTPPPARTPAPPNRNRTITDSYPRPSLSPAVGLRWGEAAPLNFRFGAPACDWRGLLREKGPLPFPPWEVDVLVRL